MKTLIHGLLSAIMILALSFASAGAAEQTGCTCPGQAPRATNGPEASRMKPQHHRKTHTPKHYVQRRPAGLPQFYPGVREPV